MRKELLSKIDLRSVEFYNFIDTEVRETWIQSHYASDLSGWSHDVLFDGKYKLSGLMSQGSYLDGDYVFLTSIKMGGGELPDAVDFTNVDDLEDVELFKQFVLEREYDQEELIGLTQEEKDTKFYDLTFLDSYYAEFNYKLYTELLRDCVVAMWDMYGRDEVINNIENNVNMHIEYEEEQEELLGL